MPLTLIGLHGFTLNGAIMRLMLRPLSARLPRGVTLECPDGPNPCNEASVARMQKLFGNSTPPPHQCWFNASDDGRQYQGFEHTKAALSGLIESSGHPVGMIGFSQGAIAAASLAALAARGQFPKLAFVVLIAGRVPRADDVIPCLASPVAIPSLHVWGERDPFAQHAGPLLEAFDSANRRSVAWPGGHAIPKGGVAADAIVEFIVESAGTFQ